MPHIITLCNLILGIFLTIAEKLVWLTHIFHNLWWIMVQKYSINCG